MSKNPFAEDEPTVQIPVLATFDVVCGGQRQELTVEDGCFRSARKVAEKFLTAWRLTSIGQGQ